MPPLFVWSQSDLYCRMPPSLPTLWPLAIQQQIAHMSGRPKMQAPRRGRFCMPALASHPLAATQKMPGP